MANTLYDYGRELFLIGDIDWRSDSIKVSLVDVGGTGYVFSPTHKFYDSVASGTNIVAGPNTLNTVPRPVANGAADGDDLTFSAVASGKPSIEAIIIFKDTGNNATSPLIAYIDTATGLPITPNGGDIIVTWDNGVNKIFRL
jgi:hypothetical protein